MNVGDLVCWHTEATPFKHYAAIVSNPGIVLEMYEKNLWDRTKRSYLIRWHDGNVTTEHEGYLKLARDMVGKI